MELTKADRTVLETLKRVPVYAAAAGHFHDSRTNEMRPESYNWYQLSDILHCTTEDLYHFEKYGDPLPPGVYEWALEHAHQKNLTYKDRRKEIGKLLLSFPAETTDDYVYDRVKKKNLKVKLKRYTHNGFTWTNSDIICFCLYYSPIDADLYKWACERLETTA